VTRGEIAAFLERDWYELGEWNIDAHGGCSHCGARIAGVFEEAPGERGARRMRVRMAS